MRYDPVTIGNHVSSEMREQIKYADPGSAAWATAW
jgi:hypothetical protein